MKRLITSTLLALSTQLAAQSMPNFNQMDFNKMASEAAEAEACMKGIKQEELQALEREAKQFEKKIDALCQSGKRAEAQSTALGFAMKINQNETLKTMRRCTEKLTGMMANMMPPMPDTSNYDNLEDSHICD